MIILLAFIITTLVSIPTIIAAFEDRKRGYSMFRMGKKVNNKATTWTMADGTTIAE